MKWHTDTWIPKENNIKYIMIKKNITFCMYVCILLNYKLSYMIKTLLNWEVERKCDAR